jgi:hypothetical protein
MNRLLMGTAAAVALTATGAMAQEWSATTGGFLTMGLGYVDIDDGGDDTFNEVALIRDGEVIFNFRLTADNGITFGSKVELEMGDAPNIIDEADGFVQGSFGTVRLGENDGAADAYMGSGLVDYTFAAATDGTGFIFDYYARDDNLDASGRTTSDAIKLTYFTPNFSGFEAGVSFVPSLESSNGRATDLGDEINAFEVGAQYSGEFGGFGITIGGGYVTDTSSGADDDDSIGAGAKVEFSGFQVGVNWGYVNEGFDFGGAFDVPDEFEIDSEEQNTIGVGVAYGTGPWLASLQYATVIDGPGEESFGISGDVGYSLAPGVTVGASVEYGDPELELTSTESGAQIDADRDEAFAAGLWMGLNF